MSIDSHRQIQRQMRESLDYWIQGSILEFVVSLQELLDKGEMRRKDLADAVGVSEATVSKALRPDGNLTVATMNKFAAALGAAVHIHVEPREHNGRWVRTNNPHSAAAALRALRKAPPAPKRRLGVRSEWSAPETGAPRPAEISYG